MGRPLGKGRLDGRVRYGKSAAGADALQNLAEVRTRVLVAIASWSAGALSRFRNRKAANGGLVTLMAECATEKASQGRTHSKTWRK